MNEAHLHIDFSFWEKVWGMHGSFSIPRSHIVEITHAAPQSSWKDLRAPGTFLPGVIKAGTYYTPRGKEFWYVTRKNRQFVTVELRDERYKRIVLSLPSGTTLPEIPTR